MGRLIMTAVSLMIAIVAGILSSLITPYLVRAIGRTTPAMHRILINSMRERFEDEVVRFYNIHGQYPHDPDHDPIDHPEDSR